MKRIFITGALVFFCSTLSFAQQIINTNHKASCTYVAATEGVSNCADETLNATFTFKENHFQFIHTIGGIDAIYTIESKTYESPWWTYRISDGNGVSFNLQVNQSTKEFNFFPVTLTDGAPVYKYSFN